MKTTITSGSNSKTAIFCWLGPVPCMFLSALGLGLIGVARGGTPPPAIPFPEIGIKATADYHGDALGIAPASDGARLRCGFQKLQAHATTEGLWLESTAPGAAGKLRLVATTLRRGDSSTATSEPSTTLPTTGTVSVEDKVVRFTRPGVTEEYSVSADGLRQDFVIPKPPLGMGDLCVELALSGAQPEAAAGGARLRLDGSGRVLAYSRLRVEDATGRELEARLEVLSSERLAVRVADANATYPMRIDPTFSDANWVSLNPGIPGADNYVLAIAADASGNMYVGGCFRVIGTVLANGIAKWDGSAWSALGSGMPYTYVNALAVSGTNLYAGGSFTTAGGVTVNGIAKWNGNAWSALGSGLGGSPAYINALAVSGTNLYAGGSFTRAGGLTVNGIAKWDGSAWSALGSGLSGGPYQPFVRSLAVSGTDLYVGGRFTMAGWVAATNIAKWNGNAWSPLGSGLGESWEYVCALAVWETNLYAGGSFITAGGVTVNYIAKWDGNAWSALGSGMNNYVWALAGNATNLYAGGWFAGWPGGAGGLMADRIARWDGSTWWAFGSGMNNEVDALAVSGTDLYAGGRFTTAGGVTVNGIAKWDGSVWSALDSGMNNLVYAVAMSGTNLYAGGEFTTAGGVAANHIAKWDGSAWSALGSGVNSIVKALAVSGTNLYAGGYFTMAGGVTVNGIAKWNGNAWSPLGSGMGGNWPVVFALAVRGTDLYAGGQFSGAGGLPASRIAKWDGTTWSPLGSGVSDPYNQSPGVFALAVIGTDLYAGGDFGTAGGMTVNRIAKWNGSAWSALSSGVGGTYVYAIAVSGTNLYAGGQFGGAGGLPASRVAKWDGTGWSALGSGVDASVYALANDGAGHLFVGGIFSMAGTNVSPFIAQANVGHITILTSPQSQTAEIATRVQFNADASGSEPLWYGWYFASTNLLSSTTNSQLTLTNVQVGQSGSYIVVVTNFMGSATSAPARLNVIVPVPRRAVPALTLMGQPGSSLNLEFSAAVGPVAHWTTFDNVLLTQASQWYFDLTAPLPSQGFYRAWQAGPAVVIPVLDLDTVPAITLTGAIGSSLRLDYINQFGPTDAWVNLATVTLTNTTQLYFDTSVIGQPPRLYRIVPMP